jgi:lariat debranching enzyme
MSGQLGSPPLLGLLRALRPEWWFAAHLHTRFEACVVHGEPNAEDAATEEIVVDAPEEVKRDPNEIVIDDEDFAAPHAPDPVASPPASRAPLNPDEITLDDLEDEVVAPPQPPPARESTASHRQPQRWTRPIARPGQSTTNFLALDKCGPKRQYIEVLTVFHFLAANSIVRQVVDIPVPGSSAPSSPAEDKGKGKATTPPRSQSARLTYDLEWLAISRAFHPFLALTQFQRAFPPEEAARALVAEARTQIVADLRAREPVLDAEDLEVTQIQEFVMTAPGPGREDEMGGRRAQRAW